MRSPNAATASNGEESLESASSLEHVKFGDVVFLKGVVENNQSQSGFFHVETCFEKVGFMTETTRPGDLVNFDECLFVICPMLNYDSIASKRLLQRRPSFSTDPNEQVSSSTFLSSLFIFLYYSTLLYILLDSMLSSSMLNATELGFLG